MDPMLRAIWMGTTALMAPDDGAGAASAAGDGAGGGSGAGEGGGEDVGGGAKPGSLREAAGGGEGEGEGEGDGGAKPNGQAGGGGPYHPDGLPDHYRGATDQETIDKVFKALTGYRNEAAERGAVPKEADGYSFEATEKLKPFMESLDGDELMKGIKADFHAAGITDKQFAAAMPAILERLLGTGKVGEPIDFNARVMELVPQDARGLDPEKQKAAAGRRISAAIGYVDGLKAQHAFDVDQALSDKVADFLVAQLGDHPLGIRALEALKAQSTKIAPATTGEGGGAALTDQQLQARLNDERNDPRSRKYDRNFHIETDALYQQRYGTEPRHRV